MLILDMKQVYSETPIFSPDVPCSRDSVNCSYSLSENNSKWTSTNVLAITNGLATFIAWFSLVLLIILICLVCLIDCILFIRRIKGKNINIDDDAEKDWEEKRDPILDF